MTQKLWWRSILRREMVAMLLIVAGCFILMYRVGQQYFPAGDPHEWALRHLGYWAAIAFLLVIFQRWRAAGAAVIGTAIGMALSRLIDDPSHGLLIFVVTFVAFVALGLWSDHRFLTRRGHRHVATADDLVPGTPH